MQRPLQLPRRAGHREVVLQHVAVHLQAALEARRDAVEDNDVVEADVGHGAVDGVHHDRVVDFGADLQQDEHGKPAIVALVLEVVAVLPDERHSEVGEAHPRQRGLRPVGAEGGAPAALQLGHVGGHALVGREEVLGRLQRVRQVGARPLRAAARRQQLGRALPHLDLQGDALLQVILLEVMGELLDVVEVEVLQDLDLARRRLPEGQPRQRVQETVHPLLSGGGGGRKEGKGGGGGGGGEWKLLLVQVHLGGRGGEGRGRGTLTLTH